MDVRKTFQKILSDLFPNWNAAKTSAESLAPGGMFEPSGVKSVGFSGMDSGEMALLSFSVRSKFPPEKWAEITLRIGKYLMAIESELPVHFVLNGMDVPYRFFVPRDSNEFEREGWKIGEFLEDLFEMRGYRTYSMGEQKPVDSPEAEEYGTGWGWNIHIAIP